MTHFDSDLTSTFCKKEPNATYCKYFDSTFDTKIQSLESYHCVVFWHQIVESVKGHFFALWKEWLIVNEVDFESGFAVAWSIRWSSF